MTTALRRLAFSALLVGGGTYAAVHLSGPSGLPGLVQKWQGIRTRRASIADLKARIQAQKDKLNWMKHDLNRQRLLTEEELKVAPKGHIIFRYPPKDKPASSKDSAHPRE